MPKVNGLVIKLPRDRQQRFRNYVADGLEFGEPVPYFEHSNSTPLICFVVESGAISHIAYGKGGQSAGSGLRKLSMHPILALHTPLPLIKVLSTATGNLAKRLASDLENGGLLTPKGIEHVINSLMELAPETKDMLLQFSEHVASIIKNLAPEVRSNLAVQKEAVLTALLVAGQDFDRTEVRRWTPTERPTSFLDGLGAQRLSERQMILADFRRFPGFEAMEDSAKSSVIFTSPSETLTVIHADSEPLERLTGADLIYYNETYKSFVFVQYKALEGGDATGYRPDAQLDEEVRRMDALLAALGPSQTNQCGEFRLHGNPFFLKLCPRMDFVPEDTALAKGMYIPLAYWKLLESSGQATGPRGGRFVSFDNVGRYLTNTEFAMLVVKAWVGSDHTQSSIIAPLIRETLRTGRAVLYAVKEPKES
ncbi:MAG: hypothetical protein LBO64_08085 [Desulfovibrio sp.]|jgi:hypothetical protein|nr:hypothetical protein [Desulfovibrio sp.]